MKKKSSLLIIIMLILFSFSGCKVTKDKIAKYSRDKKYDKIMSFINDNYKDSAQNELVVYSIDTILTSGNSEYIDSIEDLFYKDDAENLRTSILKVFNDYGTAFKSSSRFFDFFAESHWEMDEVFEQESAKMIKNYDDNMIYDYLKKQIEYCVKQDSFNRAKQIGQAFYAAKEEDENLKVLNELIDSLIENPSENKDEIKEETIKFMDGFAKNSQEISNIGESGEPNRDNDLTADNNTSLEDKLKQLIFDFNYAWVDYVNNGSRKVYNYIVPNGDIERIANKFDREGVKQQYIDIQVKDVKIEGNSAYLKVYEKLNVNRKGKAYIKEYNWLYEAQKIDGQWLLRRYTSYGSNNKKSNSNKNQNNNVKNNNSNSNNKKVKFGFDSNIKYKYEDINNSKKIAEDEKYEFGGEYFNYTEQATETLKNFNKYWLKYINDGDKQVFSYIVKDSECYNTAMKYESKKLKERFLDIKIGDMRKGQDCIYVWCYEKIEEDVNGKKSVKEYHWIYKLKQHVMEYHVDSYIKDPAYN